MEMQRDKERKVEVYLPIRLELAIAMMLRSAGYFPPTQKQCDAVFQMLIDAVLLRTPELPDGTNVLFSAVNDGVVLAALSE